MSSRLTPSSVAHVIPDCETNPDDENFSPLLECEMKVISKESIGGCDGGVITNQRLDKMTFFEAVKVGIAAIVASTGIAASFVAFSVCPYTIVYVTGFFCLLNSSLVVVKEKRIANISNTRRTINRLRSVTNLLQKQTTSLNEEIGILEPDAARVIDLEQNLSMLTRQNGIDANTFILLLKENQEILAQMRENLRQETLQCIVQIVLDSDRNNDKAISKAEAKMLSLKASIKLNEYGIQLDTRKFCDAVARNSTIHGVISVLRMLIPDDKDQNKQKHRDKRLDNDDDDDDDVFDMFYLSGDSKLGKVHTFWDEHEFRSKHISLALRISPRSNR